jgi:hypothetical protein
MQRNGVKKYYYIIFLHAKESLKIQNLQYGPNIFFQDLKPKLQLSCIRKKRVIMDHEHLLESVIKKMFINFEANPHEVGDSICVFYFITKAEKAV